MGYQETILKPISKLDFNKLLAKIIEDQKIWYIEDISAYTILEIKKELPGIFNVGDQAIVVGGERYFQKKLENHYKDIGVEVFFIEYFSDIGYLNDENYVQNPVPYKYTNRDFEIEFFKEQFDNVEKEFQSESELQEFLNDFCFIYGSIYSYISEYHYNTLSDIGDKLSAPEIHKKIDISKQQAIVYTTKDDDHNFRTSKDLIISWKLLERTNDKSTYLFTYKDTNLES